MPQNKILVTLIEPNPYQPETRRNVPAEVAEQFGRSLLANGMLQTPLDKAGARQRSRWQ